MTYPNDQVGRIATPVPVEVQNWAPPIKDPVVKTTSLKTYILDPAGTAGPKNIQITDYEPGRMRLEIQVIDVAVVLTLDPPVSSPDTCTASTAPGSGGRYLPPNNTANSGYEFYGPDAFWLNSLTAVTRITVTKEYS